jgi:hypothetical protein
MARINPVEELDPEQRLEVFDAFIKKCKECRSKDISQIVSYAIVLEMIENIGVKQGHLKCPCCGAKQRKEMP